MDRFRFWLSCIFILVVMLAVSSSAAGKDLPPPGEAQIEPGAESDLRAVAPAKPGVVFRYTQTFGATGEPYIADGKHLARPWGLYIDGSNNVWVTEELGDIVTKLNTSGGVVKTIGHPGVSSYDEGYLSNPVDIAVDGYVWIADENRIAQYDLDGNFQQQMPTENPWEQGDDNEHFKNTGGIALDGSTLFVSDWGNHRIQVYTVSGTDAPVYSATIGVTGESGSDNDHFNNPGRLAVDSSNRLYVVDNGNNRIQRCTLAGTWSCATFDASVNNPSGIWVRTSTDDVFIVSNNDEKIRKCPSAGACSDFVTGLDDPKDVAVDSSGNIFVTFQDPNVIQKYNSSGTLVGTFAGTYGEPYLTDDNHFFTPRLTLDKTGNIYVIEEYGQRLLKLNSKGALLWQVGEAGVTGNDNNHFYYPRGVAVDAKGNVYVASGYRVQIFKKNGAYLATLDNGGALFGYLGGIAVDSKGNIYVSDDMVHQVLIFNNKHTLIGSLGVVNEVGSDNAHFNFPAGIAVDGAGNIYVADKGNCRVQKFSKRRVYKMTFATGACDEGLFDVKPEGVWVDAKGRVFVSGWDDRVQVYDKSGAYLTSIGMSGGSSMGQFFGASGVGLDKKGNLYVADYNNARIQKFAPGVDYWTQINVNGFGQTGSNGVYSLAMFKKQLYAGSESQSGVAELWRKGKTGWIKLINDGFGDANNLVIDHLLVFNGMLYASTANCTNNECTTSNGGQIYRSADGASWTQVVAGGFGSTANAEIFRLANLNGQLCAGTWADGATHGAEIWCSASGDPGTWTTQLAANGFGNINNTVILDMLVYNNFIYAATGNSVDGGQIWRLPVGGGTWQQANTSGFDGNAQFISALAVFKGGLYAATRTSASVGTQVWRCSTTVCNPTDWVQVNTSGMGDSAMFRNPSLAVVKKALYLVVGTTNNGSGMQVWKTTNGTSWKQVGFGGFGDANNFTGYWNNATLAASDALYVGTINNANYAELWKHCPTKKKCK
jgi:sugar lactone lactonase YvrE